MHILFLTTAHNSLSQRLEIELAANGHRITIARASDASAMMRAVSAAAPDLILAPMLTKAVPEAIWRNHLCLIVHPGIVGDRGPSSLDWAIQTGARRWGVTVLQAAGEMDAGDIWSTREFAMPAETPTKSALYRNEVTEAAVAAALEAVARAQSRRHRPEPLDYSRPDVRGRLRPPMRQSDRALDWTRDTTDEIVRKISAADSAPGVLDVIAGAPFHLFGAFADDRLKGPPGQLIAQRDGAVCRATREGAVWLTHLKAKRDDGTGIKRPAMQALAGRAGNLPVSVLPVVETIDYRSYREIRYVESAGVGYVHFNFANGAMSTEQCYRLRDAFLFARSRPTRVVALIGGPDFFSNGIHLNVIEAAANPALESWRNINAINDLIHEMLNTMSHLIVAGVAGNAGAGGAMLALAADRVFAREGVVFNPHYKSMGGLYGSEYWTYTLPRRVGAEAALALTDACRPMGVREAKAIGFIDDYFATDVARFEAELRRRAEALAQGDIWRQLRDKHARRLADEQEKPLCDYRTEELTRMRVNFFGADDAYHRARRQFVFKAKVPAAVQTPERVEPPFKQIA